MNGLENQLPSWSLRQIKHEAQCWQPSVFAGSLWKQNSHPMPPWHFCISFFLDLFNVQGKIYASLRTVHGLFSTGHSSGVIWLYGSHLWLGKVKIIIIIAYRHANSVLPSRSSSPTANEATFASICTFISIFLSYKYVYSSTSPSNCLPISSIKIFNRSSLWSVCHESILFWKLSSENCFF